MTTDTTLAREIEIAAEAIWRGIGFGPEGWSERPEWIKDPYRRDARNALTALRSTAAGSALASTKAGTEAPTEYGYLTQHHEITEKWVGIARLHLSRDRYGDARTALDRCVEELKEILPAPPAPAQGEE